MADTTERVSLADVAKLSAEHYELFGTGGVTLASYPPDLYAEIAQRLKNAIENGEPCDDATLCAAFGVAPPSEGNIA